MSRFLDLIFALILGIVFLIPETAFAANRGVGYPYEQMQQWQEYPARIDKPCNPYNKIGCPDFIIQNQSPVKIETATQDGSVIKIRVK